MSELSNNIFSSSSYIPHGHCYLWQTPLVGLHGISDILIAVAYYSIPLMLIYFVRNRDDVPFKGIFFLFSGFIILCGTTHLLGVFTLWIPWYWLSGIVKASTAIISVYTAFSLYPIIPVALATPSPAQLEQLNKTLAEEIKERNLAQNQIIKLNIELENRVKERTKELEEANKNLKHSQIFTKKITDSTPNILYIYDVENHQNIYVNKFIEDVLGFSVESFKIMNIFDKLIHPEDQSLVIEHLNKCHFLVPESFLECSYRIKDIYGNWHWLQSRDRGFEYNNEGKVKQILGVATDITKRKEVELEMQKLNQELAQRIDELEIRNQDMISLGKINDLLLTCSNLQEATNVLADLIKPIFPDTTGAFFIVNNQINQLEKVSWWGDEKYLSVSFEVQKCWALRIGNSFSANYNYPSLFCQHFHGDCLPKTSLCVPLIAQGKNIGLFFLCCEKRESFIPEKIALAETVSQQVALAFANLNLQENLQNQSWRDGLTGLYNRRYLDNYLPQEIQKAERNNYGLGLMMIDVDYFKHFNDTYGHQAGDFVLEKIALFLQKNIREYDFACRYGGEELTVILTQISMQKLAEKAENIRLGIKQLSFNYDGKNLGKITVSIGIAIYPDHGKNAVTLLKQADDALFQAKKGGRDQVKMIEVSTD